MPNDNAVVSEKSTKRRPPPKHQALDLHMDEAHYWIVSSTEKFDFEKAAEALGEEDPHHINATIAGKDSDYHAHLHGSVRKDEVNLHIAYFQNDLNEHHHRDNDITKRVVAEELVQWLAGFFKYESCEAHNHMDFIFSGESRASKVFPLPMRTPIMGDAEIDGVSLNFLKSPQCVSKVRLSLVKDTWYVETIADKKLVFKTFSLLDDLRSVLSVVDSVLEARKAT